MTEPNPAPLFHEKDDPTHSAAPPKVMFITILLLISGLLLTSGMLIHYGLESVDENGKPVSGLTQLMARLKSKPAPVEKETPPPPAAVPKVQPPVEAPAVVQEDTALEETGFSLKNIFSKKDNGKVRWPRLTLSGFGLPARGEAAFAIINGKHVIEGSTINNVVLLEILSEGVVVEYKGETKTLIVEMTR